MWPAVLLILALVTPALAGQPSYEFTPVGAEEETIQFWAKTLGKHASAFVQQVCSEGLAPHISARSRHEDAALVNAFEGASETDKHEIKRLLKLEEKGSK